MPNLTIDQILEETVTSLQKVAQRSHDNDEALLVLIKALIVRVDFMQEEIDELKLMNMKVSSKDVN